LALSSDGKEWIKPSLGVAIYEGSNDNNVSSVISPFQLCRSKVLKKSCRVDCLPDVGAHPQRHSPAVSDRCDLL
jgi:hypothetical protein